MANKEMTERGVFAASFLSAAILICLYHTLRSYLREIMMEKIGITSG